MTSLPWSDIFKPTTSDKPTKKKTSPPRVVWVGKQKPSDPVGEKQSVNIPFQPPTIQPGLVGSEGKMGRAPPFIVLNPKSSAPPKPAFPDGKNLSAG
jgi:hypothetical protein